MHLVVQTVRVPVLVSGTQTVYCSSFSSGTHLVVQIVRVPVLVSGTQTVNGTSRVRVSQRCEQTL